MRSPRERFGSRARMYASLGGVILTFALGTALFPRAADTLTSLLYGGVVGGVAWLVMRAIEKAVPPSHIGEH